jgi:hypothetical protein
MGKRIKTLGKEKNKLWKLFSQYVRRNEKGKCFTCTDVRDWKEQDAGHFIDKSYCGINLCFDERNVHCQCSACNMYKSGNIAKYALNLEANYGKGIIQELFNIKNKSKGEKWTIEDFDKKIAYYKGKLKEMDKKELKHGF